MDAVAVTRGPCPARKRQGGTKDTYPERLTRGRLGCRRLSGVRPSHGGRWSGEEGCSEAKTTGAVSATLSSRQHPMQATFARVPRRDLRFLVRSKDRGAVVADCVLRRERTSSQRPKGSLPSNDPPPHSHCDNGVALQPPRRGRLGASATTVSRSRVPEATRRRRFSCEGTYRDSQGQRRELAVFAPQLNEGCWRVRVEALLARREGEN